MIIPFIDTLGTHVLSLCEHIGAFVLFLARAITTLFTTKLKIVKLLRQIESIGINSLTIAILTGTFSGMVFALQSYIGFQRVGGEQFIGAVVALGMVRELGPVLTGLMVTGRAG